MRHPSSIGAAEAPERVTGPRAVSSERRPSVDRLASFKLETPALTFAYWASAATFSLAFWLCRFPPLIDYPQHVATGALLQRTLAGGGPERELYELGLITYNGGFHFLVALLSFWVSPEISGKLLLSTYPIALAYAALSLVRVAGRPGWYAFLALPITMSFVVGWGFANYFISIPFAVLAFVWWLRGQRGERGMLPRVLFTSALLAYTHVLATLCLCTTIGVGALVLWPTFAGPLRARLARLLSAPLWVLPAVLWSCFVFVHNRLSPHANWEGWDDGRDDPLWYKLTHATSYAVGNFSNRSDQVVLVVAVALLVGLWRWEGSRGRSDRLMRSLGLVWAALYCVVPKVFIATWFIFERFPTFVLLFFVAAAPVIPSTPSRFFRRAAVVVGLAAALNTAWHFAVLPDQTDADAILDDIPENRRVLALTFSNHADPVVLREMWVHHLAYYQARKRGLIGYSFARFESQPVHFRIGKRPPLVPGGIEWDPSKYDWTAPWARYWDTLLVRTPDDAPEDDPRPRLFGRGKEFVKIASRRGRFWLLDASGLGQALGPVHGEGGAEP